MNPDTLVAVSAYAGDLHQVEANLGAYMHHRCPVVILSPQDAPIKRVSHPGVMCLVDGLKGWTGPQTLERHCRFLKLLLKFPYQHFLFNDSDSFCLSPELPNYLYDHADTLWSNEVPDTNPAPSMLPKIACQPPYFLSRNNIMGLLKAVDKLPISYYTDAKNPEGWPLPFPTECIDHYHLQLTCGSGFPHENYLTGASFETASAHGFATMRDLVRNHGRVMVHSVKTPQVLGALLEDHREFVHNRTHIKV